MGEKVPYSAKIPSEVNHPNYARRLCVMLDELKQEYQYSELDRLLVLKDILYNVWKMTKINQKDKFLKLYVKKITI